MKLNPINPELVVQAVTNEVIASLPPQQFRIDHLQETIREHVRQRQEAAQILQKTRIKP